MASKTYAGGCHCGAIGYSYDCPEDTVNWSIRACQCRFCRAHDALSTSHPAARIDFTANDPEKLNRYRFGLMTADFLLCTNCGVYIGAFIETDKGRFGIINTHALHSQPEGLASPAPISYDGEAVAGRISRREQRWSPVCGVFW